MKLTLAAGLFAAASAAAFAQAPSAQTQASTSQQRPATAPSAQSDQHRSNAEQTVTGCLTQDDNIFTLTVMDDSGAPGTTASTTAYTLAPGSGVDLKPFVNKRVTVKGTDAGPETQSSARVVQSTPPSPAPTGTSGTASGATSTGSGSATANGNGADANSSRSGDRPMVQTTAKARINAKTMNVSNAQPATGTCGAQ